jgi:hypothetical protein
MTDGFRQDTCSIFDMMKDVWDDVGANQGANFSAGAGSSASAGASAEPDSDDEFLKDLIPKAKRHLVDPDENDFHRELCFHTSKSIVDSPSAAAGADLADVSVDASDPAAADADLADASVDIFSAAAVADHAAASSDTNVDVSGSAAAIADPTTAASDTNFGARADVSVDVSGSAAGAVAVSVRYPRLALLFSNMTDQVRTDPNFNLSYLAPLTTMTADQLKDSVCKSIDTIRRSYAPAVFKVGVCQSLQYRYYNNRYGYKFWGYVLYPLVPGPPRMCDDLERLLVEHYRGVIGVQNDPKSKGGENIPKEPPAFLYVVVASAADGSFNSRGPLRPWIHPAATRYPFEFYSA